MSAAVELMRRIVQGQAIPAELVAEVDPVALALMVERLLGWPEVPGMEEILSSSPTSPTSGTPASTPAIGVERIPAVIFVRAVAAGDPAAVEMAASVDPLAVAYLAVRALAMPPYRDTLALLDTLVMVERALALGESW